MLGQGQGSVVPYVAAPVALNGRAPHVAVLVARRVKVYDAPRQCVHLLFLSAALEGVDHPGLGLGQGRLARGRQVVDGDVRGCVVQRDFIARLEDWDVRQLGDGQSVLRLRGPPVRAVLFHPGLAQCVSSNAPGDVWGVVGYLAGGGVCFGTRRKEIARSVPCPVSYTACSIQSGEGRAHISAHNAIKGYILLKPQSGRVPQAAILVALPSSA